MSEIYIPQNEHDFLRVVDCNSLDKLIDQCMNDQNSHALRQLQLGSCGLYVGTKLRKFETALAKYGAAKAAKKRDETRQDARRAGSDLIHAVQQMKHTLETEDKERLFFEIDDLIRQPFRFSKHLTVRVSYRWRQTVEDSWSHGSITFSHHVDLRPDYTTPPPARKPTAAKQEQDRQEKLCDEWEHLMRLGLGSVRDYFREGRNGAEIPQAFQAKVDATDGLNNFSAKFWLDQS